MINCKLWYIIHSPVFSHIHVVLAVTCNYSGATIILLDSQFLANTANQVALRSCSGTWHQKPARRLGVAGGHLSSIVWMWIRVADPKFWTKMSPQKEIWWGKFVIRPDFWELRHRSNVKYLRRGRQGHVLPSDSTSCKSYKLFKTFTRQSSEFIKRSVLELNQTRQVSPHHPSLQLSLFKCLPYNSATLKITCFFISCQYCMVLRQRVFC